MKGPSDFGLKRPRKARKRLRDLPTNDAEKPLDAWDLEYQVRDIPPTVLTTEETEEEQKGPETSHKKHWRNTTICAAVTHAEKELIRDRATAMGMTLSAWVRQLVFDSLGTEVIPARPQLPHEGLPPGLSLLLLRAKRDAERIKLEAEKLEKAHRSSRSGK